MNKKTITQIATAALITTAGITVTNNLKALNITGSGNEVKAATTQSAQQFIDKAAPAAVNASSKYGTYTSVMMAQAAVESGWGNSTLSQEPNNNLFGIKGSYNGQSVTMKTGEYGPNGYYTTNANFRKYPSYEESFNDNGSLLRNQMGSYYSGTWVENADSAEDATQNGLQGKYATAPNYSETLNNVIDTYNLKQYDPVTTEVNETKTVTNTTPITTAPVDSDVADQVDTAREGQQLNVTKYITYQNGVKHAYVGTGWVNNSAFATVQPTTPDSTTSTTQQSPTTVTTNSATPTTNTTQQVAIKKPTAKSTTVKKVTVAQQPVTTQSKPVKKPVVKNVQTKVVQKTAVSQAPALKTIKAVAKTTPTTTSAKTVQEVAKSPTTAAAPAAKKTEVTKKVIVSKPVTATQTKKVKVAPKITTKKNAVQKNEATKAVEKQTEVVIPVAVAKKTKTVSTTVIQSPKQEVKKQVSTKSTTKASVVKTGSVAPKAAATTKKTAAKTIKSVKSSVKVATTATPKQVVSNKKIVVKKVTPKAKLTSVSTTKINSNVEKLITKPIVETTITKTVSAQADQIGSDYVIKAKGVLTINARPDYGVAIWTVPGKKRTSRYLQNGTSWKFFKIAMINGEKWYNLGGNQWVPAKAVMVR